MADIAIQEYGSLDALTDIARMNGIGPAENVEAGGVLTLPNSVTNQLMKDYCHVNNVSPAATLTMDQQNIATPGGIGQMCVGVDFEIS